MRVLVTGGSGFVGRYLSAYFLNAGHAVVAIGTSAGHPLAGQPNFEYVSADTTQAGSWQEHVARVTTVVNLAGRTIFHRWTNSYKQEIFDTRILTTRNVVDALPQDRALVVLSASGAGYYGDRGDAVLEEESAAGKDFLADVCVHWEAEAKRAASAGHRVVRMRFGVVLGSGGGALAQMVPAYRMFAGGPLGSGRHWFPWIHMDDLMSAVAFCLAGAELSGPFNFCAPGTVTHQSFSAALGRALHRPAIMKVPAFALRMAMGEMGLALMNSQRAVPARLTQAGFQFRYPTIDQALENLLAQDNKA
jgi:uncharacterized protein (TIGR01777 family)